MQGNPIAGWRRSLRYAGRGGLALGAVVLCIIGIDEANAHWLQSSGHDSANQAGGVSNSLTVPGSGAELASHWSSSGGLSVQGWGGAPGSRTAGNSSTLSIVYLPIANIDRGRTKLAGGTVDFSGPAFATGPVAINSNTALSPYLSSLDARECNPQTITMSSELTFALKAPPELSGPIQLSTAAIAVKRGVVGGVSFWVREKNEWASGGKGSFATVW